MLRTSVRSFALVVAAASVLVAGAISPGVAVAEDAAAPPRASATQPFEPPLVVVGTAIERGEAYGKAYKQEIQNLLETELYAMFVGKPWDKEGMQKYAHECGRVTREVCPLMAAECDGIAKGAGVSYDDIILINLHEEIRQMKGDVTSQGHCTAVAVSPADSGDGHAYNGQTWDFYTRLAGLSAMTEWQRTDGPSVLAYGYPGMPMGAGINSQGIAVTWTSGNNKQTRHVGVPSYLMIGHFLAQKNLDDVEREAKRNKHAGIFTIVISDAAGNILNVEGGPGQDVVVERSKDRMARAYYGTRQMTKSPATGKVKLHPRCQQMYDLLESSSGKNDLATIERYFSGREYKIMGWQSPENKTLDIMIFDTTDRKAYVTRGPAYHLEWREFAFHDGK